MSDSEVLSSLVPAGWVKLFHPSGALVTLPVLVPNGSYAGAFAAVGNALTVGFTVNPPGLEDGEKKCDVGFVCRGEKENADRSLTPFVWLWTNNPTDQHKFLNVYLNDDAAVARFERASGLKLDKLKAFPGQAAPKRDGTRGTREFIVPTKPFPVVYHDNPKYDQAAADKVVAPDVYKVPKRAFLRWGNENPATEATGPHPDSREANGASDKPLNKEPGDGGVHQPTVDGWKEFLERAPWVGTLNERLSELSFIKHERTRRACWQAIKAYAEDAERCWEWSAGAGGKGGHFVAPKDEVDTEGTRDNHIPF